MIDGFRYGIIGVSDVNPWFSFTVAASFAAAISIFCILLLRSGYRLRY
jgi:ABC-2 type transport system permease protein